MEGKCPMCGMPVINDFSGNTPYPDFCRICAGKILGSVKNKIQNWQEKLTKKSSVKIGDLYSSEGIYKRIDYGSPGVCKGLIMARHIITSKQYRIPIPAGDTQHQEFL